MVRSVFYGAVCLLLLIGCAGIALLPLWVTSPLLFAAAAILLCGLITNCWVVLSAICDDRPRPRIRYLLITTGLAGAAFFLTRERWIAAAWSFSAVISGALMLWRPWAERSGGKKLGATVRGPLWRHDQISSGED